MCVSVSAQNNKVPVNQPDYNKPSLFAGMPDQIRIDVSELENLLTQQPETGKNVAVTFADKAVPSFNGKIESVASKYNNTIKTLIIRSSNFSGATLTLSSSTLPDGTVRYSGRIISFKHGDLYVLEQQNQQYFLIKKKYNDLINE
jgi:hypothetical protein